MIRKATTEDFEAIHRLCECDLGYECDISRVRERLENLDEVRECVFVAESAGNVAGFIHVEKYDVLYAPPMANILGIAVALDERRKGYGKALLSAAEDWAKERGIKSMRLNSGGKRKGAHEFYRNAGYNDEKEQLRFAKEL